MNPGAIEEGGETARSVVTAFKDRPMVLALIIMNFALIGFIYYGGLATNTQRRESVRMYVEQMREIEQLLARCVIPEKP
jgi:hypothetical protein